MDDEYEFQYTSDDEESFNVITTYDDYLEASSIQEIIITSKSPIAGYIVYPRYETYSINEIRGSSGYENLKIWLLKNGEFLDDERYNFDLIIKDILKKCYKKDFKCKKLAYSEIFILQQEDPKCNIFDCKDLTFSPLDQPKMGHSIWIDNFRNTNVEFIEGLMANYVNDNIFISNFKALCKGVFVEKNENPIVITDFVLSVLIRYIHFIHGFEQLYIGFMEVIRCVFAKYHHK